MLHFWCTKFIWYALKYFSNSIFHMLWAQLVKECYVQQLSFAVWFLRYFEKYIWQNFLIKHVTDRYLELRYLDRYLELSKWLTQFLIHISQSRGQILPWIFCKDASIVLQVLDISRLRTFIPSLLFVITEIKKRFWLTCKSNYLALRESFARSL